METLTMSRRERDRMTIMVDIKRKELTLVEASQVMDLSYRQTRRVWRRYQTDGDAGLVHRLRGQPEPATQSAGTAPACAGALRRTLLGLRPDAGGGVSGSRRAESRSRDA